MIGINETTLTRAEIATLARKIAGDGRQEVIAKFRDSCGKPDAFTGIGC